MCNENCSTQPDTDNDDDDENSDHYGSNDEDDNNSNDEEDSEADNDGINQLSRPIRESFIRVEKPRLTTFGLSPVVAVSVPHSELKYVLPDSKILTYSLGI